MDDMETRVWQRVSGKTGVTLPDLLRMSREAAACLRQLPGGKLQCRLMGLAQQEEAVSRALAGIAHSAGRRKIFGEGWRCATAAAAKSGRGCAAVQVTENLGRFFPN